ncbi:hypothetical protein ACFQX6_25445 [Streptosporangium lutulentum]
MPQNEAIEARVLDALDEAGTVRLLADLVRVPSVTGTDAESDLQHRCARLLVEAGLDVDVWKLDLDALRAAPGFPGTESPRTEGYGVVGVTEGEESPRSFCRGTRTWCRPETSPSGRRTPSPPGSAETSCTAGVPAT